MSPSPVCLRLLRAPIVRPSPAACTAAARLPRRPWLLRGLAAVTNPRLDPEGNPMTIELKPRAVNRIREIQKQDANPNLALRITVESGGCHGFQYLMSLSDRVDDAEDTVFEDGGARVVMDSTSLDLLRGSKVDYTMELIGSQFKIVDNPKATSSCGCGTSFDVSK